MHGSQTGKCSTAWGEHDFLSIKIILSFCSCLLSRNATLKHTPPYRLSGQNRIPFISDVFSWLNTIFHSHKWCVIIYIVTEIQQWCQQRMNHVQKAKKLHKLTSEKPVYCMEFARAGDAPLNKKQKITWNNLKCRTKWQLTTESYRKYINNMYVSPTHAYALRFAFPFFFGFAVHDRRWAHGDSVFDLMERTRQCGQTPTHVCALHKQCFFYSIWFRKFACKADMFDGRSVWFFTGNVPPNVYNYPISNIALILQMNINCCSSLIFARFNVLLLVWRETAWVWTFCFIFFCIILSRLLAKTVVCARLTVFELVWWICAPVFHMNFV